MSTPLPPPDAGAFAAGDLGPDEQSAFAQRLQEDPQARRELDFWRQVRPGFADNSRESLGPGFAAAVLTRAQREQGDGRRQIVIRMPIWGAAVIAAAAAALVIMLLLPEPASDGMWLEDGTGVTLAERGGSWNDLLPLTTVSHVYRHDPDLAETIRNRPWLGLWSRPVTILDGSESIGTGHLVIRVVSDSPADRVGLRPGDVIRTLNECPLFSTQCIAHVLEETKPGQTMTVDWFRPRTGEQFSKQLTLVAVYE